MKIRLICMQKYVQASTDIRPRFPFCNVFLHSVGVVCNRQRMSKAAAGPDLTKYVDKPLELKLIGNRQINGQLRGFDQVSVKCVARC